MSESGRSAQGLQDLRARLSESLEPEFEIRRLLGSGRTAYVFLAREVALGRLVAVKILRPDVGEDETARARFTREANLEAGLSHPAVPSVHRVGRLTSGLPFMVQEYIEGRTLADRLEALGSVEPPGARRILADLAGALAAAHSEGVIHRDVRPENVILERDTGRAILVDFGIAAIRESGSATATRLTKTGEILGDPQYASPEQLRGEKVTAETDVYSLGVLGYEILTLSNPFGSETIGDLVEGHLTREPMDLPWRVSTLAPELGEILKQCLVKDPMRRPRAREVERILAGDGGGVGARGHAHGQTRPSEDSLLAPFPRLAAFVAELRRRRVYQVAAAYAVAVFVVLQAGELVLDGLSAPSWVFSILVIASLAGFPAALVMAWIFDLTSSGIRRTTSADEPEKGGDGRTFKVVGLLVSTLIAIAVGWWLLG